MVSWTLMPLLLSAIVNFECLAGANPNPSLSNGRVQRIRYEDLPQLVSEHNEVVDSARLLVAAQEERSGQLARSFFPKVSVFGGVERFHTESLAAEQKGHWTVEADVNLFRGGRDHIENEIQRQHLSRSKAQFSVDLANEILEAKTAYWRLLALNQKNAELKEELQRNETNLKSSRRRIGAGLTTGADATQFELNRTLLERKVADLELSLRIERNHLAVAIGIDDASLIEVDPGFPSIPPTLTTEAPESQTKSIATSARIQVYSRQAEIGDLLAQRQGRWWLPQLDLYASTGLPSLSTETDRALAGEKEWTLGLRLTLDLGAGFNERVEYLAQQKESLASRRQADHVARELIGRERELTHLLKNIFDLLALSERHTKMAESFLNLTLGEYNRGVKNGPDLMEATRQYFEFRQSRIDLMRDFFSTQAELEALTTIAAP